MLRTSFAVLVGGLTLIASAPGAFAAEAKVTIDNFTFWPAQITVPAGTRVLWTNRDDIPHTVAESGNPRELKSRPLDTGDSFSFVFNRAGVYHYFCSIHPHMQGTVIVQ